MTKQTNRKNTASQKKLASHTNHLRTTRTFQIRFQSHTCAFFHLPPQISTPERERPRPPAIHFRRDGNRQRTTLMRWYTSVGPRRSTTTVVFEHETEILKTAFDISVVQWGADCTWIAVGLQFRFFD